MPLRSLNGGFHQDHIDAVGSKAQAGKSIGRGFDIEHDHFGCNRIRGGIVARQSCQHLVDLDQDEIDAGRAPRHRKARGTDTGAEIGHAIPLAHRRCGREQHGVVTGAVAHFNCRNRNCPPRNASSVQAVAGSVIGPQFVGETGIGQKLPGFAIVVLMDHDPARQHAERALDDAHVLVQHQMMDVSAIKQRADGGNQHDIVGSNQFPQRSIPLPARHPAGMRHVNRFLPLPRRTAVSIVSQG